MRIYENETLPAYQNRLNELNSAADQALTAYNQAENTYQMAFTAWSADQSPENTEALSQAEADRSNAQVEYQNVQAVYEDYKTQMPPAPLLSDFTDASDLVTDGTGSDFSDTPSGDISGGTVSVDTSGIEIALNRQAAIWQSFSQSLRVSGGNCRGRSQCSNKRRKGKDEDHK